MKLLGSIARGANERLNIAQLDSGSISVRVELRDSGSRWVATRKQLTLNDLQELLDLADLVKNNDPR